MPDTSDHYEKKHTLVLKYRGCSGEIRECGPGRFRGAAAPPGIQEDQINFSVLPEHLDQDGILNPDGSTYNGSLQIDISGTDEAFRELGRYLLSFAELDISANPHHHEHHEILSRDGHSRLHLILLKQQ